MAKDNETIFLAEVREGVQDDNYRIIVASSLFLLQERINEITSTKPQMWDIVGGMIETSAGFCQTMARLPKTKLMRQSLG